MSRVSEQDNINPGHINFSFAELRYSSFSNTPGQDLSDGEIDDFEGFGKHLANKLATIEPIGESEWLLAIKSGKDVVPVTIRAITGYRPEGKHSPQIVIHYEPFSTTYTLTAQGLLQEYTLPGESTPDRTYLRNQDAQRILANIQNNLQ